MKALLFVLLMTGMAFAQSVFNSGTFNSIITPAIVGGAGGGSHSNNDGITINDNTAATPYPSTIDVAGVSGTITKVTVTFTGLAHTFPSDINALLVSPSGTKVAVMFGASDGSTDPTVDLTFDDSASGQIPNSTLVSGTYQCTINNAVDMDSPAPARPYNFTLSAFNGESPNGTWDLWVEDHASGDSGTMAGWSLNITAP